MSHRYRLVAILAISVSALTAQAIVIRHDREDAKYLELAKSFSAYGDVVEAGSTLIAPRWLLTAAHVATEVTPYTSFAEINGKRYSVDRVILHPEYLKTGARGGRDLALLRLTEPVKGVEPVPLYRGSDEAGQTVLFIGRGQFGNGESGPKGDDGKMRGAHNKLERVSENSVFFQFDAPETAVDLEGISGPGDSGGPALLKVGGTWHIAGVSSSNMGNGKGLCRYGTTEVYARVSTALDWIEGTMKNPPASTIEWKILEPDAWPKSRPGEIGQALLEAYSTGDAAKMEAFGQKFRDPEILKARTAEQRAEGFLNLFKETGAVKVVELAQDPRGRVLALLKNSKGEHFQLALFFLDDESTRFEGFWIGAAQPRAETK